MSVVRTLWIEIVQEIELTPELVEDPDWSGTKIFVTIWPNLTFTADKLGVQGARLWREAQKAAEDLVAEILDVPVSKLVSLGWGVGPSVAFCILEPVDKEMIRQRLRELL